MVLQTAIWDFDGTLADTYTGILKSLQQTFYDFDYPQPDMQEVYRFIKLHSVKSYLQKLELSPDFDEVYQHFQNIDHQNQTHIQLVAGAAQTLQAIVAQGGHNFLWTHRDDLAIKLLAKQQVQSYFTQIITSTSVFARKPDPAALNYLVKKYNLNRADTAMIGDRSLDVQAGQNAQLMTIYFDVDQLHDAPNADYVVQDLTQIIPLFTH